MLVQLLDPRCIFGRLIPHHAVQSFHLLEELPAFYIQSLELAPSIQAACGGAGTLVAGSQDLPSDLWVWRGGHAPLLSNPFHLPLVDYPSKIV